MEDPETDLAGGSVRSSSLAAVQRKPSTISMTSLENGAGNGGFAPAPGNEEASDMYAEIENGGTNGDMAAVVVKRKTSQSSTASSIQKQVIEDVEEEDLSCSEQYRRYPKHVLFIVGMEFCERFSYYGMRSVLLLYLRNYLKFDDDLATSVYHAFTVLAYFTPIFGAIIADSYWGKYKTIIVLSIVYIFGHVVKVIGSIPFIPSTVAHIVLSMVGLVLIACGTGGIKPCVSSFGGDQFSPDQTVVRKQFFSLFYFAINAGSLISTFVTPILRADVDCYPNQEGEEFDECYALAFGVPAALMIFALILFIAGSRWYVRHPPEGSVFWYFCECIGSGIKQRWKTPKEERTKEHWLDYANSTPKMIRDTKYVLNVLVLFIPLPFFWALFDQQGSRWTLQAIELDGHLGSVHLKPDQIETLNPIFIVTLIPLFEVTLYPCLRRFKIPFTPLRRMTVGLFLAGVSFLVAAFLQLEIDKITTPLPGRGDYSVRVINESPCNLTFMTTADELATFYAEPNKISETKSTFIDLSDNPTLDLTFSPCGGGSATTHTVTAKEAETVYEVIIRGPTSNIITDDEMITHKTEDGGGKFSFVNAFGFPVNITINNEADEVENVMPGHRSDDLLVDIGTSTFEVFDSTDGTKSLLNGSIDVLVGAIYTVVVRNTGYTTTLDVNANSISVAWIFPQFFIITVGEVFLSITGLEFSYTQAPPSMKSVVTSIWLLTVSFGNIIVLIIAGAQGIEKQANEFFLFAGLIFVAGIIFIILAYFYVPVDEDEFEEEMRADFERRKAETSSKVSPGYENTSFSSTSDEKVVHEYENIQTGFAPQENVKMTSL